MKKKPSYFFEISRTNNRIRNVIDDCVTNNINDIPESERENVILYLKNRGDIILNKYTGYLIYRRGNIFSKNLKNLKECNIELSTVNYDPIYKGYDVINEILNEMLFAEIYNNKCFGINRIDEMFCKEHNEEEITPTIETTNEKEEEQMFQMVSYSIFISS